MFQKLQMKIHVECQGLENKNEGGKVFGCFKVSRVEMGMTMPFVVIK
jgi:hypothetical protein